MKTRYLIGAAAGLALPTILGVPAAAQSLALHESGPPARPAELAATYQVRLESAWPQLPAADGCENGGSEVVEGRLARTADGDYRGTFVRRTRLLFCGAHGADGAACALILEGEGRVAMRGTVVEGNQLRVTWTPGADHSADVRGACGDQFKENVRRMYLSVRHGAEFTVPAAGAARRAERLEEYAWVVDVE